MADSEVPVLGPRSLGGRASAALAPERIMV